MKIFIYSLLLSVLLFSSCKSNKYVVKLEPFPTDSVHNFPDSLYAWGKIDWSTLKPLQKKVVKKRDVMVQKSVDDERNMVLKGTKILIGVQDVRKVYTRISRIKYYNFTHRDVPSAFDGFRFAFISDLHYKSLFDEKGLHELVELLQRQNVDAILMGGDYHERGTHIKELFTELSKVKTKYGYMGVLGNNDYESHYKDVVREMRRHKMAVLEHKCDTIYRKGQFIIVAGIRNPFDLEKNSVSPTLKLKPKDFVILLTHTPDYAEEVSIANTDLALAGHTHGGQVTVFGYAPIVPSKYGQRFLTGLKKLSSGIPIIITNGIGTSQKPIRIGAPAEVIVITLHHLQ